MEKRGWSWSEKGTFQEGHAINTEETIHTSHVLGTDPTAYGETPHCTLACTAVDRNENREIPCVDCPAPTPQAMQKLSMKQPQSWDDHGSATSMLGINFRTLRGGPEQRSTFEARRQAGAVEEGVGDECAGTVPGGWRKAVAPAHEVDDVSEKHPRDAVE